MNETPVGSHSTCSQQSVLPAQQSPVGAFLKQGATVQKSQQNTIGPGKFYILRAIISFIILICILQGLIGLYMMMDGFIFQMKRMELFGSLLSSEQIFVLRKPLSSSTRLDTTRLNSMIVSMEKAGLDATLKNKPLLKIWTAIKYV